MRRRCLGRKNRVDKLFKRMWNKLIKSLKINEKSIIFSILYMKCFDILLLMNELLGIISFFKRHLIIFILKIYICKYAILLFGEQEILKN